MILNELFQQPQEGYQDVEDDNTQITQDDLRKTRLTLKQINKLRRMNDVRTVEFKEKQKKIQNQYGPKDDAGEFGSPGF